MDNVESFPTENGRGSQRIPRNNELSNVPLVYRIFAMHVVHKGEIKTPSVQVEGSVEDLLEVVTRAGLPIVKGTRKHRDPRPASAAVHRAMIVASSLPGKGPRKK
jgi:hypothetical protein